MKPKCVAFVGALVLNLFGACGSHAAETVVLITEQEAALPTPPDLPFRGVTRGPAIEQVEPKAAKVMTSPTPLKIRFRARNNTEIDPQSVQVTYVKTPLVDLTQRLKAVISDRGIDIESTRVPAGTHVLKIDVSDSVGRTSTALVRLVVGQ